MSIVTGLPATNTSAATTTQKSKESSLGKDDFMKLLVTQLQHQDPLKPMDDTAFIAQMAQFTTLEQMQNMTKSTLATQAIGMIGGNVKWTDDKNNGFNGTVKGVSTVSGESKLIVELDAMTYQQFLPTSADDLANKKVSWVDSDKVTHSGIIENATNVNGGVQVTAYTTDANGKVVKATFNTTQITSLTVEQTIAMDQVNKIER